MLNTRSSSLIPNIAERLKNANDPISKELAAALEKQADRMAAHLRQAARLNMAQLHAEELEEKELAAEREHHIERAKQLAALSSYCEEEKRIAREQLLLEQQTAQPVPSKIANLEIELLNLITRNIDIADQQENLSQQAQQHAQTVTKDIIDTYSFILDQKDQQEITEQLAHNTSVERLFEIIPTLKNLYENELSIARTNAPEAQQNSVEDEVKLHEQVRERLGFSHKQPRHIELATIPRLVMSSRRVAADIEENIKQNKPINAELLEKMKAISAASEKGGLYSHFARQLRPTINKSSNEFRRIEKERLCLQLEEKFNSRRQIQINAQMKDIIHSLNNDRDVNYGKIAEMIANPIKEKVLQNISKKSFGNGR